MRPSIHWLLRGFALGDSSRMLTATIQSLYILSLGASLSTIAYLQIVHSVAFLIAAISSAPIVRMLGGKVIYLISSGLVFLYFLILFQGEFNRLFYIGQIAYAVGLALIETASSDWIFGRAIDEGLEFREVMHDLRATLFSQNFIFMTVGSLAVFFLGYSSVYLLTLISLAVVAIWMLLQPYIPTHKNYEGPIERQVLFGFLRRALKSRNMPAFVIMAALSGILLSAMVPILHYWQPAIASVAGGVEGSTLALLLWLTFSCYSLAKYMLHRWAKSHQLNVDMIRNATLFAPLALSLTSIALWLLTSFSGIYVTIAAILLFAMFHCFHSFLTTELSANFVKTYCDRKTVVVFTAVSSFFGRFLVILSLYVIAQSIDSSVAVSFLWSFGAAAFSFIFIALYWFFYQGRFTSEEPHSSKAAENNPLNH